MAFSLRVGVHLDAYIYKSILCCFQLLLQKEMGLCGALQYICLHIINKDKFEEWYFQTGILKWITVGEGKRYLKSNTRQNKICSKVWHPH